MATILTATEAYKNFSEMLLLAHSEGKVIIEKNGKPFVEVTPVARRAGGRVRRTKTPGARKSTK